MGQLQPGEQLHAPSKDKHGFDEREWNALIGIITALVGNVLISFALNLQRYAHIRLNRDKLRRQKSWAGGQRATNSRYGTSVVQPAGDDRIDESTPLHPLSSNMEDEEEEQNKSYLKSPYWWAGILLMTIGEAGNFLAYGFAPASIVSPLGVVALISNCIVAPCLLKEKFRQRDFWGVLIAVTGVVTLVLSAKNSETRMGPHDVWHAITRWEFELYLGLTSGVIVGLMYASSKYGERTILIDLGLVGLFGGYTALSTKGIASLLSDTLWRALTFPITYLLTFVLIATALLQIRYLNRALQRFDSTQVIPTQFVLFTISVILGSAVLYREFESATAERVWKFVGGCAFTFLGVYCITSGRSRDSKSEEEDESGEVYDEEQEYRPQTPTPGLSRYSSISSHPRTPSAQLEPDSPFDNPWLTSRDPTPSKNPSSLSFPPAVHTSQPPTPGAQNEMPPITPRSSISRMLPGPISSPLSSSLSGVVAETLRRGMDPSKLRHRRSSIRRTASERPVEGESEPLISSPLKPTRSAEDDGVTRKTRSQSVSDSLKKIFKRGDDEAV